MQRPSHLMEPVLFIFGFPSKRTGLAEELFNYNHARYSMKLDMKVKNYC